MIGNLRGGEKCGEGEVERVEWQTWYSSLFLPMGLSCSSRAERRRLGGSWGDEENEEAAGNEEIEE